MVRKHRKSISFYLSDEDYESIKETARNKGMTMKDYIIHAHRVEKDAGNYISENHLENPSIHSKLDLIIKQLSQISITSTHSDKVKQLANDTTALGSNDGSNFTLFLDGLRTERQRANSTTIYQLLKEAGSSGISLMQARESTSSTAKNTLESMVNAGLVTVRGRRYYIKDP